MPDSNPQRSTGADHSVEQPAADHSRSGASIDEAIETAQAGSRVEGTHTTAQQADQSEERAAEIRDYHAEAESGPGAPAGPPPVAERGPSPTESGSGGAQNIMGARISDRVSAGEPVPDGAPFDNAPSAEAE